MTTLQSQGHEAPPEIAALAPWFHNLHLPGGIETAPDHPLGDFPAFKWRELAPALPDDLTGWRALDIGCNAGVYTFELARRGADVLRIDTDEHYLEQARWAAQKLDLEARVAFRRLGVYELAKIGADFDLIFFMGVLYHLRHPLLALDLVASKARRLVVLQTLTMPGDEEVQPPRDLSIDDRDALLAAGWPKVAFVARPPAGAGLAEEGVRRAAARGRSDELVGAKPRLRRRDGPLGRTGGRRSAGPRDLRLPAERLAGRRRAGARVYAVTRTNRPSAALSPTARSSPFKRTVTWPAAGCASRTSISPPGTRPWS